MKVEEGTKTHTVTVVFRVRSASPKEARHKVGGILKSALLHWPSSAWSIVEVRPGWWSE